MGGIATNTIVQIQYLKDRGMILDIDEGKLKEILLDIGYYRLGFYWNPFEIDNVTHKFKEGTKISDVINLYYLDVDLRKILIPRINRIEICFRTKLVYYASNKFKNSPTWFVDPIHVNNKLINEVKEYYDDQFIKRNKTIKAHHRKYINDKYAPAWKTIEFLTFGKTFKIYEHIKDKDIKERIAKEFGIINLDKFSNFLETIILVRNSCAHGDVLFDLKTPKGISVIPGLNFNNNDRNSLDSCIKVISYFLNHISSNRKQEMEQEINDLFHKFNDDPCLKKVIEEKTNFIF